MPDDGVNASPEDLRRLATALSNYRKDVAGASKKVSGALNSARWHDSRKTQFDTRYQELQKRIDSFMSGEVDQMVKALNEYARRLDETRRVRM